MSGLTPAIAEVRWAVLPHPAHSPDLAPSDYHLFVPVKNALGGRHFVDDTELKLGFHDVLRNRGTEFYNTVIQCHTQRCKKCVENDGNCG
jgi:histone-lysine N-methyltransferase SETMAR